MAEKADTVGGHAFISYVREDASRADELQQLLRAAGVQVWRDTADLLPGEDWRAEIRRAIREDSLVFLACFSRNSVSRTRTYQNEEILLAVDEERRRQPHARWLIPVRFDDCQIPDLDLGAGRTLASIQRADLFGDRRAEEADRLIVAVRRILRRRPATEVRNDQRVFVAGSPARARWAIPLVFDPANFVGRTSELARCHHVVSRCTNHSGVVTVSGISSTGKTALLRRFGYELSLASPAMSSGRPVVDLDDSEFGGELIAALLAQLGAPDGALDLIASSGPPAREWTRALAEGLRSQLVGRLTDRVAELIQQAGIPPVILLDDAHKIGNPEIHVLLESLIAREQLGFTLVCAWRSDELHGFTESAKLRAALEMAARQRSPNAGAQIHLAGFESEKLVGEFFERRGLAEFLTPEVSLRDLIKSPPGDLDELAHQLRDGAAERIDHRIFKPDQANRERWERLSDFHDGLQLISVAQNGAPKTILLDAARKLSISLRLSDLAETGIEIPRKTGSWYRLYPDQFSDYIFTTRLSPKLRSRLLSAFMSAGLAELRASADPDLASGLVQVAARGDDMSATIRWSEELGREALRHGWISTSLRAFRPFMHKADYANLGGERVELLLDCVDLYRQSGDREGALRLLTRTERRCTLSPAQGIRADCLHVRLARDLKGGEAARRIAQRLIRSSPQVTRSYEFLNQLARIERDTGRIKAGLQHVGDARKAVARAGNSRRAQAAKAEILYTAGSIERLAGLYANATRSLHASAKLRAAREDHQGRAYVLLELAMCALVQDREDEAGGFLAEARSLSRRPEISDSRGLAYADTIESCIALCRGDLTLAEKRLAQAARWTSTREQGIRGNPPLIEAVLLSRSHRAIEAAKILEALRSSDDRTVQATAALIHATVMPSRRAEMTATAHAVSTRNGFSLQGIGAELLAHLSVPTA